MCTLCPSRAPYEFVCETERLVENTLQELRMPAEMRRKKHRNDCEKLQLFEKSMTRGSIAATLQKTDQQIDKLVAGLTEYLKTKDATAHALKQSDQRSPARRDEAMVLEVAFHSLYKAITSFPGYSSLCKWAEDSLQPEVHGIVREFNILQAEVGRQKPFIPEVQVNVKSPWWVSCCNLFGKMSGMVGRHFRELAFWGNVGQAYDQMKTQLTAPSGTTQLREIACSILTASCPPIQVIKEQLNEQIDNLRNEIEARVSQEKEDIPRYEDMLRECKKVTETMSQFILELNMHTYKADADITWPDPRTPVASWSFGEVYKVSVHGIGEATLKIMTKSITGNNASDFMKELKSCRYDYCLKQKNV